MRVEGLAQHVLERHQTQNKSYNESHHKSSCIHEFTALLKSGRQTTLIQRQYNSRETDTPVRHILTKILMKSKYIQNTQNTWDSNRKANIFGETFENTQFCRVEHGILCIQRRCNVVASSLTAHIADTYPSSSRCHTTSRHNTLPHSGLYLHGHC